MFYVNVRPAPSHSLSSAHTPPLGRCFLKGMDPASSEGLSAKLDIIQFEVDSYRPGGRHQGLFPEKWLPAAIIVGDTPFTEQNGMLNTTSKMVRGKVEKFYAERIEYAMTAEGKDLYNPRNIESLKTDNQ